MSSVYVALYKKWSLIMLFVGITGSEGKIETANIISSIVNPSGKKVCINDSLCINNLDSAKLKSYIDKLAKDGVDIFLLKLSSTDFEWALSNKICFDIIIFTGKFEKRSLEAKGYYPSIGVIQQLLDSKGIAIVNVDDSELLSLLQGIKKCILTYGFNSKASVTTSSIGDSLLKDGVICCLQRTIFANNGSVIEPQEYKINVNSEINEIHNILAAASFALVNGIDLNNVNSI